MIRIDRFHPIGDQPPGTTVERDIDEKVIAITLRQGRVAVRAFYTREQAKALRDSIDDALGDDLPVRPMLPESEFNERLGDFVDGLPGRAT